MPAGKDTMSRADFPAIGSGSDRLREILETRPPLNLYRMLPRAGILAEHFLMMGGAIRNDLSLDPKIRELAIVRTGILTDTAYEVHHHRHIALAVGVKEDDLAAVEDGELDSLDPRTRATMHYVDSLCLQVRAPDDVFEEARRALGVDAVAHLTIIVGFYLMAARFLRNFDIEIESDLDHHEWL